MELSNQIEEDLRRLNDAAHLPEKAFDELIEKIFSLFTPASGNAQFSSPVDKQLIASLLTFVIECVKHDLDEAAVRSKLDDLLFNTKSRQDRLLSAYAKHLPAMQLYLKQQSVEHDRLLDVHWRLDLQLKTNYTDKLLEPIYTLDWTKRERYTTDVKHIQFTCSQESLQELLEKLKDAQSVLHQMQYQNQPKK